MLEANKKIWFEKLFAVYNRNLLKRRFHSSNIKNFEQLQTRDKNLPLIIYANHSSWWDGLVLCELLKSRDFDSFVMMEEKQLRRLKLFRKLGAFSVIRENLRESIASANYAANILKSGESKTLLIFPQGEILPNQTRPLKFYNGLAYIIGKIKKCNTVPCSIRYEFLREYKPEIFVEFGEMNFIESVENFDRKKITARFEQQMTEILDDLCKKIAAEDLGDFQNIL